MALDLTALEAQITRDETVKGSATILMTLLFNEVEANKNNPAALQALVDRGRVSTDALAAAILANTPSVEEPPPPSAKKSK